MRESAIRESDQLVAGALYAKNSGFIKKLIGGVLDDEQIAAKIEAERPIEDTKHLQEQAERRARMAAIQLVAAKAHHDIEDLTAETISGGKLPTF
jgi:tellurite resistance protein